MAGIGFQLQKLFKEDHYSSRLKAYGFSLMVTSGPWLTIITAITLAQLFIRGNPSIGTATASLFNVTLAYCFVFSQVVFSIQQLIITRFTANELYEQRYDSLFPVFVGSAKTSAAAGILPAVLFLIVSELPFYFELLTIVFFYVMLLNWTCFLFVSALKNYKRIALSFAEGGLLAGIGVYAVARIPALADAGPVATAALLLTAFTLGMTVTLFMLFLSAARTFNVKSRAGEFDYWKLFDTHPKFVAIGLFYTAGLWVGNWVIWFGEGSSVLFGIFRFHGLYDTAVFWSYLSIVPTLMYFVVSVETRFYDKYRTFYGYINKGGSLKQIEEAKRQMQRVMKQMLYRMLRNQALITGLLILAAGWLGFFLNLDSEFISILRLTLIGAYANAGMLVFQLLQLYFEDHKGALYTSLIFFFSILLLSLALLPLGEDAYGMGFSIGASIAFLFAGYRLNRLLGEVDAHAFQSIEPVPSRRWFTRLSARLDR